MNYMYELLRYLVKNDSIYTLIYYHIKMTSSESSKKSNKMTIKKKYEQLCKKLRQYNSSNGITKKTRKNTSLTDQQVWNYIS
jgi:hypothetical protein